MEEEIDSIEKNQTWELVELPQTRSQSTSPQKVKLMAKGFLQRAGIDYGKVCVPIASIETIILVVAIATKANQSLHELDVKVAFLNGPLEEEVYVQRPRGFELKSEEQEIYRLKKSLYGLMQAPRAWNKRINGFLDKIGFVKSISEHGAYMKVQENNNKN